MDSEKQQQQNQKSISIINSHSRGHQKERFLECAWEVSREFPFKAPGEGQEGMVVKHNLGVGFHSGRNV